MRIIEARKKDLPDILKLYRYLFPSENYLENEDVKAKWDEITDQPGLIYLIGYEGDVAVASCNISIIPNLTRGLHSYALIENVITHPDYRRKGFGRAVVLKAVELAKEANCYKVMLLSTASEEREAAHHFYESIGFDGNSKRGFYIRFS